MNIAIVGGGIVGLSLGYKLSKIKGNKIHVFEKEKEVGYWGEQSSSGKSLKWTCTNSLTFQDTCSKQRETKHTDENWLDAIWDLLKRI